MLRLIISTILFVFPYILIGQSVSATYTAGDIPTRFDAYDPTCNGPVTTLTVSLPGSIGSYIVTGIDIEYDMTAQNNGWMSDQKSQIHFQNTNTTEPLVYTGAGNASGTFSYQRLNVDIANGLHLAGTDLIFEMRAWRTFGMAPACGTEFNKVDNSSWTITVYYEIICAVGNFVISNQTEADNFINTYGACNKIDGNITMDGSNSFNSSGFSFIDTITGNIDILNYSNAGTPSIQGFNNVKVVNGIKIENCSTVTDLSAFNSINFLGNLTVLNNSGFTDFSGIPNITQLFYLGIANNSGLSNLIGLEGISFIYEIQIGSNPDLTSLQGLDNLDLANYFLLVNNPSLIELNPFPNLEELDDLVIEGNNILDNPGGFSKLKTINEDLIVKENESLKHFFEFPSLEEIIGKLTIQFNDSLETISSMPRLLRIKDHIEINSNDNLISIDFFKNLKAAFATIDISFNTSLSDCCAIRSVVPNTVTWFYIENNSPGCNSFADVDTTCVALDPDQDGILTADDNCPNLYNPNQEDADSDGVGNACDNCPLVANPNQADSNNNFIGNACESPASKVNMEIESHELFLNNNQKGLILTDPNGNCYRLNIDLEGNVRTKLISCP